MKFRSYVEPPGPSAAAARWGCSALSRPRPTGQFHPGRPVHVQPVPRTVFVGTVRRSSSARGNRRAPLQAYLLELLTAGGLAESAMPAFQGPAESGAGTIGCGRFDLVVGPREFDERPSLARFANAARQRGEHGWPVLPARSPWSRRAQSGPAASHYR